MLHEIIPICQFSCSHIRNSVQTSHTFQKRDFFFLGFFFFLHFYLNYLPSYCLKIAVDTVTCLDGCARAGWRHAFCRVPMSSRFPFPCSQPRWNAQGWHMVALARTHRGKDKLHKEKISEVLQLLASVHAWMFSRVSRAKKGMGNPLKAKPVADTE